VIPKKTRGVYPKEYSPRFDRDESELAMRGQQLLRALLKIIREPQTADDPSTPEIGTVLKLLEWNEQHSLLLG